MLWEETKMWSRSESRKKSALIHDETVFGERYCFIISEWNSLYSVSVSRHNGQGWEILDCVSAQGEPTLTSAISGAEFARDCIYELHKGGQGELIC